MAYSPSDAVSPETLLQDLLSISLTAVNLLRPLYDPAGELTDFAPEYFNPAAQRMTGLFAERPAGTARTLFPDIFTNGIFAFYRRVFESGEAGHFALNYQADGLDNYFRVAAQRSGELLIVSFTDTADQDRSAVELALRDSQAAEQAARAETEIQRQRFYDLLMQLPAQVAVHEGPDQVFTLVNPGYQRLAPGRELQGQPIREAWPELVSQGILDVLDHVYQTGEPFIGKELPFQVDFTRTGTFEQVYFNAFFLPLRDAQGQLRGVLDFSYDVTEQVLARQQLQQVNAALGARVQERTQVAEQAQATAERERNLLQLILDQSPVAIGVFQGEELRITATNAQMAALWGRTPEQVLNQPFMDGVPELRGQGFDDIMRQVLRTEVPFLGTEIPADVLRGEDVQTHYYNFVYQPLYDADGQLLGAIDVAVEVTEQVLARRQVEQLNQELEARVQERTEQLRAAQAAAERERAQLQALLTQAPVAIALFQGDDLHVATVNPEMAAIWGHPLDHVRDRPLLEGVPELRGQGFDDLLRQVMATQVPVIGKEAPAVLRRNGQLQTNYYNFVYQPLYDAEGQIAGVIDVAVEVTEQVLARQQVEQLNQELEARVQARTQEALALQAELLAAAQQQAQAREAFYQVFEQTTAAVALLRGPHHRYEYVNSAYRGFAPHRQLVGGTIAEELPELYSQGFGAILDRVYQTGETYFGVELPFTPDPRLGEAPRTSYFNFTYQAYRENGEVAGVSIFAFDVTEQVLARQEREAQRGELQRLFEQAPVAIAVFHGPQYVIELANPSVCALWGRSQQNALGTPLFELLPEVAGQGFEQLLDQVRATGEPFVAHELPSFIDRNGRRETVYWNFVYAPLREADGTIERVTVVATDGTEQVLARQQVQALNQALTASNADLHQSNTQLTRTNVDLDNFIYTASHDLKAPITNIEGLLLALEHELPPAARPGDVPLMLTLMQDAVDRFRRTITHLTDLSRLQKEHNPASDAVALAPVVEAVRLDLTPLLAHTRGQLTVSVPEGLTVTFAEKNLRSVVYNLLSNAFKYHHPDRVPAVQLRGWLADDYAVLEVQDNGLGLDLAQGQDKLFAMFQRLHTHVEGTGVGLYMVKRILENAGGRIEVDSQLGQGSTFRVYFPR